jgi:hypothetical protein
MPIEAVGLDVGTKDQWAPPGLIRLAAGASAEGKPSFAFETTSGANPEQFRYIGPS